MSGKIILDCDPGHDDAIAIILAYGSAEIDLLAITTVAGNQTLDKVTNNARAVSTVIGMTDTPIAAGSEKPLVQEIEVAGEIHGESGLDGPKLPKPTVPLSDVNAVDLIIETVMNNPSGTISLVATGSLTNVALAARKEPKIIKRVKEVVIMGGGYNTGNWSAVAEFNIITDPEAAHIVFNEDWKVTMVGLDLTHQALATQDVVTNIKSINTSTSNFIVELLEFFTDMYKQNQGFEAPPVHDPCTVAYLIDPSVVTTLSVPVDIELTGKLTRGMTVADFRYPIPKENNTFVATKLNHTKFWDLIYDALSNIG
ncbi:nucleoside hydrolase [Tetragenococcus muriaticus]|uniref:Inosine-uridine preferring nucleoside hydrolase n=1 Tax=Tetragenococcus muriaticus 3MR10-3 TaxID=1302648 RepID=A0A091CC13_9ENTE|nr:nucleoside hydrolase [Tetragenococcus muriaticus]KFN89533.1 inosine-uridine preferring nucleoside hydrolase [Tetragenococcus muriaticus 3MR10-3]GMA48010.1 ribosylpyrimidine nucleosidase [Tetragenococcus muriaticus]